MDQRRDGDDRVVTGTVTYEKGAVPFEMRFRGTPPKLHGLHFDVPKALDRPADPTAAPAVAKAALDALLAAQLDPLSAVMDPELAAKMSGLMPKLREVVAKFGRVEQARLTRQAPCDDDHDNQCLVYEIRAAKGKGEATFTLSFFISRWYVDSFNLTPP